MRTEAEEVIVQAIAEKWAEISFEVWEDTWWRFDLDKEWMWDNIQKEMCRRGIEECRQWGIEIK